MHKQQSGAFLSHYEAVWLDKHYHFNNRNNVFKFPSISAFPKVIAAQKNRVLIEINTFSNHGLHQAQIFRESDIQVIGWHNFKGEGRAKAKFDVHRGKLNDTIIAQVMDRQGNFARKTLEFTLPDPILDEPVVDEERRSKERWLTSLDALTITPHGRLTTKWAELKRIR